MHLSLDDGVEPELQRRVPFCGFESENLCVQSFSVEDGPLNLRGAIREPWFQSFQAQ
jgi:hypothetical protein